MGAALFAAQHKLSHLIAFLDYNHQQLDGYTKDICDLGDMRQKFQDFGWYAWRWTGMTSTPSMMPSPWPSISRRSPL